MDLQIAIGIAGFLLLALWHLGRWNASRELQHEANGPGPAGTRESGAARKALAATASPQR